MDGETMGFEGVFAGEKTSAICADENFLLIVRLVVSVLVATQIGTVGESHSTLVTLKEREREIQKRDVDYFFLCTKIFAFLH